MIIDISRLYVCMYGVNIYKLNETFMILFSTIWHIYMYTCGEYGKQIHNLGLPGCIILDCMSLNSYPVCSSTVVDLTAKVEILKSRVIYTCSYR